VVLAWQTSPVSPELSEDGPGSSIKNIYYSGINDAFMVELRCASCVSGDEILADRVIARYV
jgi:hypothetical protein